jgi:hypothetical protein
MEEREGGLKPLPLFIIIQKMMMKMMRETHVTPSCPGLLFKRRRSAPERMFCLTTNPLVAYTVSIAVGCGDRTRRRGGEPHVVFFLSAVQGRRYAP